MLFRSPAAQVLPQQLTRPVQHITLLLSCEPGRSRHLRRRAALDIAQDHNSAPGIGQRGHSGLQFLRAIRAIPGLTNTPVAIVTGDYYLDDMQTAEIKALGAELRYKPLWLEELVTLARELLSLPVRD